MTEKEFINKVMENCGNVSSSDFIIGKTTYYFDWGMDTIEYDAKEGVVTILNGGEEEDCFTDHE
jgi:hypothetical protein